MPGVSPVYYTSPSNTVQSTQNQQTSTPFGGLNNTSGLTNKVFGNAFSGIKDSINQFGTNFGLSSTSLPTYSGVGPSALPWMQTGSVANPTVAASGAIPTASGATLTGTLGAAGIGSLAGNFLGGIGGNKQGGSIGGGVGAGIGYAVGGPVGGVIGGLVGGIGGGFFGSGKPKVKASEFDGLIAPTGGFSTNSYGSKTMDTSYAKGLSQDFGQHLAAFQQAVGQELKPVFMRGGFNDKQMGGGFLQIGSVNNSDYGKYTDIRFNPDDQTSKNSGYAQALRLVGERSGVPAEKINAYLKKYESNSANPIGANPSYRVPTVGGGAENTQQSPFQQTLAEWKSKNGL